nr:hypothetical protein [Tanacetum cinerariifolium]
MSKNLEEHGFVSTFNQRTNHKDLQNCLFACFIPQEESKKVIQALKDPSWIEAIQEELLQFKLQKDDPYRALKDKGIIDSGCSRHMIGNKAHLADYQEFKGGSVAFGGSNGRKTGKGKIKTGKLDFKDVYYVEELKHYNLFFVSQICDKKNKVLFTNTDCLVLSPDFKLSDENQVLIKIPKQHNMYSFNLKNIDPSANLACLFAKALINESNKWHKRLGHVNFKNLNKLVNGNLVRRLPSKIFKNDHTCVACQKGKKHKAACKAKTVSYLNQPLQILHMDLFRATSDETTPILKDFIRQAKNQFNHKREYSNARTPQQNRVAERKNRTVIKATRTMLADSFLPTTFWAEAVSTACYVLNRVSVTKPQNKTSYELLTGRQPIISYLRPFGCHVTILNTIDQLGKFDGSVKTASTHIRTQKPLVKDEAAADMDVTPKTLHVQDVKRIFRYLKGQPKLGLWYPKVSSFDLEAYSDSDYAGLNLDRKSTTGGCQFLGRRFISWQCKKQTIVATSTTEAEYVTTVYCCGQVL